MKKLTVLFLLLIIGFGYSLSSAEVKNFFASESHYLEENQDFSETPFFVKSGEKNYYVIILISGNTPTGFAAVPSEEKIIVDSSLINRKLFRTAYVLYSINSYKGTSQWMFSASNKGKFNTLTKILSSDVPFKLNSIKQGTVNTEIRNKVDLMNSLLSVMSDKSAEIESAFDSAISLESDFTFNPLTEDTDKLKEEYGLVFSLLQEFKDLKLDYSLHVIELKKLISDSELDSLDKQQFLALANEPLQLDSIDSIFSLSESVSQRIEEIYSKANSQVNSWTQNVSLMIERNSAYDEIYSEDKTFYSKTKNNFYSLDDAYSFIVNEENSGYWKEQEKVSSLTKNFSEAEKAFGQKNYVKSMSFAEKAKNDAIAVISSGFIEQEPFDFGLIIIGLAVLLSVLVLFNNRRKFFKPKEESEVTEFKF